jgi:hypothetical protein
MRAKCSTNFFLLYLKLQIKFGEEITVFVMLVYNIHAQYNQCTVWRQYTTSLIAGRTRLHTMTSRVPDSTKVRLINIRVGCVRYMRLICSGLV